MADIDVNLSVKLQPRVIVLHVTCMSWFTGYNMSVIVTQSKLIFLYLEIYLLLELKRLRVVNYELYILDTTVYINLCLIITFKLKSFKEWLYSQLAFIKCVDSFIMCFNSSILQFTLGLGFLLIFIIDHVE